MDDSSREITISRILDAPADLVFKACTEAEHLAKWWGPDGFSAPVVESDPRPGGGLRVVMRGPDGVDHPMTGVYREVVPPRRLVVETAALDADGTRLLEATITITFEDHGDKTEVTVHSAATALVPQAIAMLGGMKAGWTQSLQCLDDMLTGAVDRQIVISRLYQAPAEVVFDAWTQPDQVSQWWGPNGFSITIEHMDVSPRGEWRFTMHSPDDDDYPNLIVYAEIVRPERLVFARRAPGTDDPGFRATVTLDELMGMTALTLRSTFETADARDMVMKKNDAVDGGNQTLDRLGEYLRTKSGGAP
jgi:uncharacterized protein YndB with AHSA1/START domain